mmetsp:Transcript_13192/g.13663  ORF Transcript_13192/g.13663 Transcript_13192/m.13663 type:complete len:394 (+) Transcript_13192:1-1182(+)
MMNHHHHHHHHHQPAMQYGTSVVQDLKIVQSQVGKLIGPGGSTIKDLQSRFAVKMNIDQLMPDTDERRLRITGDPARVQAASQMIWHLLNTNGQMGMIHPGMQNQLPHGYGMQMLGGDGYSEASGMMHGYYPSIPPQQAAAAAAAAAYGSPNHIHIEPGIHPSQAPVGQGLGADGSSGRLMPPTQLNNGLIHQVVYVLKSLMQRILGPNNTIMYLIIVKSGANVEIEASPVLATGGQEMTKINLVGPSGGVTLAGQMIQEVLINGPDKLSALPDAPPAYGYENPNFAQQQSPQPATPISTQSGRPGRDLYGYNPQSIGRSPPVVPSNSVGYPAIGGYNHIPPQSPNMIPEQGPPQYPPVYPNRIDPYARDQLPQPSYVGNIPQTQYPNQTQLI